MFKQIIRSPLSSALLLCLITHQTFIQTLMAEDAEIPAKADESEFTSLFDGKTLTDWKGDAKTFRVEDKAIVGGTMKAKIPHNEFIIFQKEFKDFELLLEAKLIGEGGNAGIQIRSRQPTKEEINSKEKGKHIPAHEMVGYQVDMGKAWEKSLVGETLRRIEAPKGPGRS